MSSTDSAGRRRAWPAILLCAALVAGAAVAVAVGAGDDRGASRAPAPTVDSFDSARAWSLLRRQVALGPRPAGTRALRGLARELRRALPNGRFERVPGHPGLRNVVGRLPGRAPALVIAAHYDTKDLPGLVGANDGAAGTAAVVEIARALAGAHRPPDAPALRFVLFDGEEAADDRRPFRETGLRGSTAYATRHGAGTRALILLDFIAARDLRISRERSSHPGLWRELRRAARAVGTAGAFPPADRGAITDDHTPFVERGIPAINLIQWPYECWHKPCDDLSAVAERSLDRVGETVLELVRRLDDR